MDTKLQLQIRLFGRPEFYRGPVLLPSLATHKTQSLLAFLILRRDRPHSRDELSALFWGDQTQERARHSLATALWRIRRLISPDEYLLADAAAVQFDGDRDYWLDTAEFEKLLNASRDDKPAIDQLRQAVELYRGDLLEGFYDDWCIEERYRLESLYLDALNCLVAAYEAQGDPAAVLAHARKHLAHDPLQESLYLAVMRAFIALGDDAAARHEWQRCCEVRQ
ncbi:MAG TPA: BTAD domain-containing putative transcriptional regulator, partial [Anaerolineae bacterium]